MLANSAARGLQRQTVGTQRPTLQRGSLKASAFLNLNFGGTRSMAKIAEQKQELLDAIAPLQRGLLASREQKAEIDALASAIEKANPTKQPLASPLLNGRWLLRYTTSDSILGTKRPQLLRPSGPIYQTLDGRTLKAKNQESGPFYNSVIADLTPLSKSKVKVQFRQFKLLNLIPITAPPSAVGELDVTYLDEDLRISRGDKGNLFILTQSDPDAELP